MFNAKEMRKIALNKKEVAEKDVATIKTKIEIAAKNGNFQAVISCFDLWEFGKWSTIWDKKYCSMIIDYFESLGFEVYQDDFDRFVFNW